ncbi:SNF1-related protein kinase regulatory subunit gamma-like PV42b [Eucalyptus grandis]|uniref:SNF1-related protein kinase regulatory subunit gamma-like PV42b n=1 Tax=Eucalyptus grandis TaxID=71139 RepID=UPI00192EB7B9|nr:SNF1-related protein kinase regulatory subunit gamma-like PV42b [Eucalyptus grandis]
MKMLSIRSPLRSSTFSRASSISLLVHTPSQTLPKSTTATKTDMQEIMQRSPTSSSSTPKQRLREQRVGDLILHKRRLVDVPHTASLADTMNVLVTNRVLAVPVAAPPGRWIGAGGSMILEADQETGAVRKQYIGIVTMLDILSHIAEDGDYDVQKVRDDQRDLGKKMATPVSLVIGHNLEGLSLWTFNPNTSILDCMEVLSKGIHRALVPIDSHMENIAGVELVESAPSYRMLTQMDVVQFLKDHSSEMEGIATRSIREVGAVSRHVYVITDQTKVIEAIKCMRVAMINAVPIVASEDFEHDHSQLLDLEGEGRKLMGTFSATDLRGCHLATLQSWLSATALDFTEKISKSPLCAVGPGQGSARPREPVTCTDGSSLAEAMDKAVEKHVHRVWVVDQQGLLTGVVSLTDMIRVLRVAIA